MTDAYLGIRFEPQEGEAHLIASDSNGNVTILQTEEHTFNTNWTAYHINYNADDETVEVRLGDPAGTVVMEADTSAYTNDLDFHTEYYAENEGDAVVIDEVYLDGEELEQEPDTPPEPPSSSDYHITDSFHKLHRKTDPTERTRYFSFRPDGEHFAVAGNGGSVHIYDIDTWNRIVFREPDEDAHHLEYSPDGEHLLVGLIDSSVLVYDTNYDVVRTLNSSDHVGGITSLDWHPSGDEFVLGTNESYFFVYDSTSDNPEDWYIKNSSGYLANRGGADIRDATYSPDGKLLGLAERGRGSVSLWEVGDYSSPIGSIISGDGHDYRTVDFDPNVNYVALGGGSSEQIRIYDIENEEDYTFSLRTILNDLHGTPVADEEDISGNVWYGRFSSSGRYFAYGIHNMARVHIYDVEHDFEYLGFLDESGIEEGTDYETETVEALAWHPTDQYLVYGFRYEPDIMVHDVPFRPFISFEAGASMSTQLEESRLVISPTLSFDAGSSVTTTGQVEGEDIWHLLFEDEAIIVDGLNPSITQTITPGDTIDFTLFFENPERYREQYQTLMSYSDISRQATIRHGLTDAAIPWYRERSPTDKSLLVRLVPGADLHHDHVGWWGLILDITDASHSFAANRAVEMQMLILSSHMEQANHQETRDVFEAPIFIDDIL